MKCVTVAFPSVPKVINRTYGVAGRNSRKRLQCSHLRDEGERASGRPTVHILQEMPPLGRSGCAAGGGGPLSCRGALSTVVPGYCWRFDVYHGYGQKG